MTHDGGEQTALRRSAAVDRVSHVIEPIGLDRTPARRPQRVHAGGFVEDPRDMSSALKHGDLDRLGLDRHGSSAAVHVTHGASIMTRRECRSAEQHPRASRRGYAQMLSWTLHLVFRYAKRRALIWPPRGYIVLGLRK